jgi:hypothetical protein
MYLDIHQDTPAARRCQCTGMMKELGLYMAIQEIINMPDSGFRRNHDFECFSDLFKKPLKKRAAKMPPVSPHSCFGNYFSTMV